LRPIIFLICVICENLWAKILFLFVLLDEKQEPYVIDVGLIRYVEEGGLLRPAVVAGLPWRGGFFASRFLVGELSAVDGGLAGEVESQADLVALDLDDADDTFRFFGVADDDFFADPACKCEHALVS